MIFLHARLSIHLNILKFFMIFKCIAWKEHEGHHCKHFEVCNSETLSIHTVLGLTLPPSPQLSADWKTEALSPGRNNSPVPLFPTSLTTSLLPSMVLIVSCKYIVSICLFQLSYFTYNYVTKGLCSMYRNIYFIRLQNISFCVWVTSHLVIHLIMCNFGFFCVWTHEWVYY